MVADDGVDDVVDTLCSPVVCSIDCLARSYISVVVCARMRVCFTQPCVHRINAAYAVKSEFGCNYESQRRGLNLFNTLEHSNLIFIFSFEIRI